MDIRKRREGAGRVCFWWFSLSKCEDLSKYPLYWWLCFHCPFPFGCKLFMGWMNFSTFSFFSIGEFASWLLGRPSVWKWGSFVIPNIRIGQQSIPCQDIFWGWIFKKQHWLLLMKACRLTITQNIGSLQNQAIDKQSFPLVTFPGPFFCLMYSYSEALLWAHRGCPQGMARPAILQDNEKICGLMQGIRLSI